MQTIPTAVAGESTRPTSDTTSMEDAPARRDELLAWFSPDALTWKNVDWTVLLWIGGMHLGCLAAPFFFSWQAVVVTVVLHWLTASIGICLGYHRYLSHRGFKLSRPAEFFVYLCGCLATQGKPLTWAANHRLHHARSDKPGDPHSPRDGKNWAHSIWLLVARNAWQEKKIRRLLVPDLMKDPLIRFFDATFLVWSFLLAGGLYLWGGWTFVVWGMCVRMTLVYHGTWLVNSATHLWGYRSFETTDDSRNLWWVALIAYGEGWHNNHHRFPRLARAGYRWWELDMTFWAIRFLQFIGQASDVYDEIPEHLDRGKQTQAVEGTEAGILALDESDEYGVPDDGFITDPLEDEPQESEAALSGVGGLTS